MFSTQVVPVLKDALLTSLHNVFEISTWFLAAFFTGKIKLSAPQT